MRMMERQHVPVLMPWMMRQTRTVCCMNSETRDSFPIAVEHSGTAFDGSFVPFMFHRPLKGFGTRH